jgi:drug/metabolite transporter (DMT)-like permease
MPFGYLFNSQNVVLRIGCPNVAGTARHSERTLSSMNATKSASSAATVSPKPLLMLGALLTVYVIWGSTYLGIRLAIASIPPFFMAGTRYLAAGGAMFLFAWVRGAKMPSLVEWRDAVIVGACLLLVGNGGVTFAEQYVPSGTAALLVATVPVFLTVFAWLTGVGPRPGRVISFALLLGLLGVSILARPGVKSSLSDQNNWYAGMVALLIAAAVWAGGSLYSRKAARPSSAIVGVGIQMISGGALLLLVSFSTGEAARFDWSRITAQSAFAWVYLVVFGAIIAFTAYIWLVRVCSPALVGTYAFVNPVVAVLLGWAIAGENLDRRTICGAAVIVVAVVMIVLFSNRSKRAAFAQGTGRMMATSEG